MTSWLPPLRDLARAPPRLFAASPCLLSSRFPQPPSGSPGAGACRELFFAGGPGLQLDVVFDPDFADQLQLRLDEVDMLLFAHEDLAEQVAGHEVAYPFAVGDRLAQLRDRLLLEPQVALEDLRYCLADEQLFLFEAWRAAEKQDALDQHVGVLHFVDRFVVFIGAELDHAPVLQDASVQEILIERGHLILQNCVEVREDGRIALHGSGFLRLSSYEEDANAARPLLSTIGEVPEKRTPRRPASAQRQLPIEILDRLALLARMRGAGEFRETRRQQLHCCPVPGTGGHQGDRHPDPFGRYHKHVCEKTERCPNYRNRIDPLPVPIGTIGLEQCDEVDAR